MRHGAPLNTLEDRHADLLSRYFRLALAAVEERLNTHGDQDLSPDPAPAETR